MRVSSFKVNGRCDALDAETGNEIHSAPLEREENVNIEDLESSLVAQIEEFRRAVPGKQLVLVLNSAREQADRVLLEFPAICRLFSAWIDPSNLASSNSPSTPSFNAKADETEARPRLPDIQVPDQIVRVLAMLYRLKHPHRMAGPSLQHQISPEADAAPKGRLASRERRALVDWRLPKGWVKHFCYIPDHLVTAESLVRGLHRFDPIVAAMSFSDSENGRLITRPPGSTDARNRGTTGKMKSSKGLHSFVETTERRRCDRQVSRAENPTPTGGKPCEQPQPVCTATTAPVAPTSSPLAAVCKTTSHAARISEVETPEDELHGVDTQGETTRRTNKWLGVRKATEAWQAPDGNCQLCGGFHSHDEWRVGELGMGRVRNDDYNTEEKTPSEATTLVPSNGEEVHWLSPYPSGKRLLKAEKKSRASRVRRASGFVSMVFRQCMKKLKGKGAGGT